MIISGIETEAYHLRFATWDYFYAATYLLYNCIYCAIIILYLGKNYFVEKGWYYWKICIKN